MKTQNAAFSGFFRNGNKRIDLVLVIGASGDNQTEQIRINFLMNAIKFGFELELEEGTMPEHRSLIFVKVHATDSIIEEYGLYFNERKFFKDSHVEFLHPFGDPLGMRHEKDLIKIVRKQYPGPVNYSTLERSKIVYNIFLRLPFEQHLNRFGVKLLLDRKIIIDVFALHDGPYFFAAGQGSSYVNARQTLFYNWVGMINIWRTQPAAMIQEYLGERIAYYFAYYEYFNWMLMFPAALGVWNTLRYYYIMDGRELDRKTTFICSEWDHFFTVCPQCRYFKICPFRRFAEYCNELKFINAIEYPLLSLCIFTSLWAIIFPILWKKKFVYLSWLWEIKERHRHSIIRPEYYNTRNLYRSRLTGVTVDKDCCSKPMRVFTFLLYLALFGVSGIIVFVMSVYAWYLKPWLHSTDWFPPRYYFYHDREHLHIAMGAGVYSILTGVLKMILRWISYFLTGLERHRTYASYDCSIAFKLYWLFFPVTFALLTFHLVVENFIFTHMLDMDNWYSIWGIGVMNNGLGTSLDDMCVTLAIAVVIEQIVAKLPEYIKFRRTDYLGIVDAGAPCWEREYKLDTIKEDFFHTGYIDIVIQFAMCTLFSPVFPLANLIIFVINIWDIRHQAKILLLSCRRPLLHNVSGPGIWHKFMYFTAILVPICNGALVALQTRYKYFDNLNFYRTHLYYYKQYEGTGSPAEQMEFMPHWQRDAFSQCMTYQHKHYWLIFPDNLTFAPEFHVLTYRARKYSYLFIYSVLSLLLFLLLQLMLGSNSTIIKETIIKERRIKERYFVDHGILPVDE